MCVHDLAKNGAIQELRDAVAAGKVDLSKLDAQGNSALMTALIAQQWDTASGNVLLGTVQETPSASHRI